jgi:hypothetical protein
MPASRSAFSRHAGESLTRKTPVRRAIERSLIAAVSAGAPATTRQREIDALHLTISIGAEKAISTVHSDRHTPQETVRRTRFPVVIMLRSPTHHGAAFCTNSPRSSVECADRMPRGYAPARHCALAILGLMLAARPTIGEVSIDYDRNASFVEYRTCALDPAEDCTLAEDDPVQHARLPGLLRMVV